MKRFTWLIVGFALAISLPLAYFAWRTYEGLKREDVATLQYFSQAIFDRMENALDDLVSREEKRAVDEYRYEMIQAHTDIRLPSPLSRPPTVNYILGYLQNNPDGSFQTPLVKNLSQVPPSRIPQIAELQRINRIFNAQRRSRPEQWDAKTASPPAPVQQQVASRLAERYVDEGRQGYARQRLGQKQKRMASISAEQVSNLAAPPPAALELADSDTEREQVPAKIRKAPDTVGKGVAGRSPSDHGKADGQAQVTADGRISLMDKVQAARAGRGYRIEMAPMQPVWIEGDRLFLFRRIQLDREIYRQGVILRITDLMNRLAKDHFERQPMARYAGLRMWVSQSAPTPTTISRGALTGPYEFTTQRRFPAPFDFLEAQVVCRRVPPLQDRHFLNGMWLLLAAVLALGLTALYRGARSVTEMAERRSKFVSSVTHELKTPITNIRMYVEMLEQGVADTPQKEQTYYRILNTETRRLSHLIQNVLELSKLENKRRGLQLISGDLQEPLRELARVMADALRKAGFELILAHAAIAPTRYDPEVVLHILTNLVENSIKFGLDQPRRCITVGTRMAKNATELYVSDTGPGIPRKALKKIFADFYRAQDPLTAGTRGTGIGLALVKRLTMAMGGRAQARNNATGGCTISVYLPLAAPLEA